MTQTNINEFNQIVGCEVKNWHKAEMPQKVSIQGQFCILEPLDIDKHSFKLFETLSIDNQGESWTYLPYGPFANCDEFQSWIKSTTSEPDTILYAVLNAKSQLPIGIAGFLRINPEHGVIEVGHLHYSTLLKKTPAATEAMYLMMKYAFENLGYRRYEWKCNSLNQASRNAALRLGFKFEGIFRQNHVFKNRNRDTAWFSIIDSEWPEIKEKFQKWLSPSNFDSAGNQIVKLADTL
jgi:RimJ/RimL family protein N-acetyltransferase